MTKRMLITLAHPDDESFGIGSLIARYVAEGVETTLICTTNGDVGTVDDKFMQGYDSVSALRLAELDCAAKVLGFKEVITWGYRDSGMMGSADNNHPQSSWQAPLDEMTNKAVEAIRRIKPQVIITFDPFGGYGHPDHIKINKATLAAFEITKNDPDGPQKLYYPAFPRLFLRIGVFIMRLTGKDPRKMGRNQDMDAMAILDATLPVHTRIDVSRYQEIGERAASCHASQGSPRQSLSLGSAIFRLLSRTSGLYRAYPAVKPGDPIEHDLYAGVIER